MVKMREVEIEFTGSMGSEVETWRQWRQGVRAGDEGVKGAVGFPPARQVPAVRKHGPESGLSSQIPVLPKYQFLKTIHQSTPPQTRAVYTIKGSKRVVLNGLAMYHSRTVHFFI